MLFKALETKQKTGEEQDASSSQTPQDKAKARRAQVRKAQIEHRQRKANYVKQLEIEVARTRDMIAASQMEARLLQAENIAMRSRVVAGAVPPLQPIPPHQETPAGELPEQVDMSLLDHVQLDDMDSVTLSLGLDDVMNIPVYQISSEPTSSNYPLNTYLNPVHRADAPEPPPYPFAHLNPDQTQQIINFILA
jgi:hypothetical protein